MTASDRPKARDSTTRDMLVDATSQLMVEEGYAAATSRRVAAKAGVKPALVHYYFPTMDELYLAVFRIGADRLPAELPEGKSPLKLGTGQNITGLAAH